MKKKDMVFLVIAVVILLVAGYLAYTKIMPQKSSADAGVTVEKIGKISSQLDQTGLKWINDTERVKDFNSPADYSNLDNPQPFGP
jgi:hypothetical protein